ncbi:chemotaxis response regulator protein-glutamate methylesterase [Catenovulum sp. 2E275]|uniref:protein-glutamate methylesterase/protein-glutamine glutaminase n=1 Tax=Catenovulum sp. 2E275 TaxID=2980497 RepID=UPI0021D1FC95|nr:chemotaxis response regulator protein-glutamate methylesterase [Catenovulum sp. 2E275]MCU4674940.1 chemotaxis response regulator protein-glutamate methylesterase [Catenovulum sp. 2E275]
MPINVLVVDDSSFFRRRVSEIIEQDPDLAVIDTAVNGKEAVEKAKILKPDVITMDIEMPVLDGISAVREIMQTQPIPILMFSSLTHDGAQATLEALEAGALDFLPKKFEDIARNREEATAQLLSRIKQIAKRRLFRRLATSTQQNTVSQPIERPRPVSLKTNHSTSGVTKPADIHKSIVDSPRDKVIKPSRPAGSYKLVAIGTSTGGPVALQTILTRLPAHFPVPIILIQHMPAAFTPAFAARLNGMCKIEVKEAQHGDILKPGCAYLAPGGKQMMIEPHSAGSKLVIKDDDSDRLTYKPSVDLTFASAAKAYRNSVLAVVLTGMGADGREGARMLKNLGSVVWAQDEASCVVYGMPQAVASAGIATQSISLEQMADRIQTEIIG